jgi:hypothetical protein
VQAGDLTLARTSQRVWRLAPMLAALCLAAGCGAAPPVAIPSASPSPTASPTTIAPGVRVPGSEIQIPPYTVSTTHPLPSGVSAATVAQDVVIDNLIENVAIERGDPALLPYADCGNWLTSIGKEIGNDKASGIAVLSIRDSVATVVVGTKIDPADPSLTVGVVITGTEVERAKSGSGPIDKSTSFAVIRWLAWDSGVKRYLTCDTGSS